MFTILAPGRDYTAQPDLGDSDRFILLAIIRPANYNLYGSPPHWLRDTAYERFFQKLVTDAHILLQLNNINFASTHSYSLPSI